MGQDMSRACFRAFIREWNARENRATPEMHLKIADWLEECWKGGRLRLLLMAFRGSGKSTIAALFASWLLYINPDLRILVLAADARLAGKMAQQIRKVIERHDRTSHLKPEKKEQWAGSRFTVKRDSALRDPSVQASGITMNITGSHADMIICDDVEVPKTCTTREQRENLRERLAEIEYILDPKGTQIYLGTPHSWFSIYADKPRIEAGEERAFLAGFERLEIPVLDADNNSAWPEKYSLEGIEKIKAASGPNKFASQMMLQPLSVNEGRLDPDLIKLYSEDINYSKELGALFIGDRRMESSSCWWDPAFGSKKGDRSVLAVTYQDNEGNIFLHHMEYMKVERGETRITSDLADAPPDRATAQCRKVGELAKKYYLPSVTVEDNGVGKFLPGWLRTELAKMHVPCGVKIISSSANKDTRILEALDALMAAGKLYMHKDVVETPFLMEMKEWRPHAAKRKDDGLDALSGAISDAPVRISRQYLSARQDWGASGKGHIAKTEFEV